MIHVGKERLTGSGFIILVLLSVEAETKKLL